MMVTGILRLTALTLFLACSEQVSLPDGNGIGPALVGAWQERGGERLLNIQNDTIIELGSEGLKVRGFERWRQDELILLSSGFEESWKPSLHLGVLRIECRSQTGSWTGTFDRLNEVPEQVILKPLALGDTSRSLPHERVQAIQSEIQTRFKSEQALYRAVWKDRSLLPQTERMKVENLAYLRDLLRDVGWLDAKRFGTQTSVYAVILAKHTNDLRLMMTILPLAERDLKGTEDSQTFAVLYDALQLDLGRRQVYGTQVAKDERGPYLLPFEGSPEAVDQRLRALGLPSLQEYRDEIGQALYAGQKVRLARNDG